MKKLVKGIIDFRNKAQPSFRETFAKLALGQSPDALYIGCSDSRVAVNVFASTEPGDLFVVRNVGNLIPPCGENGMSAADESEAAAIEFALNTLKVSSVILCGHSECGAMQALLSGRSSVDSPNLKAWLRHGEASIPELISKPNFASHIAPHNRLSQLNVLKQIENLKTYPIVQERLKAGNLNIFAWWFEVSRAEVMNYNEIDGCFVPLDEAEAKRISDKLN